ncbi:hypothetical protein GCM10022255_086940 [Dactylosporangium darangshiense]|uniref:Uncharacterized protein n=1 Tax=Dactylosporangium darangshiense TaxID=579108 RepID=A0ABP8DN25_9ACTN
MAARRARGERYRVHRLLFQLWLSAGLIAAVVASPLLLAWVSSWPLSWPELSDVGQAYGTVSAVLSALGFCGIAISIYMQREQYRVAEQQAVRQRHFDLLTFTIHNPEYLDVWGAPAPGGQPAQYDRGLHTFSNLVVSHWYMLWRIGNFSEADLRNDAANFFRGAIGREFWTCNGATWIVRPDPIARRFLAVLNDEYAHAEHAGPPAAMPALPAVPLDRPARPGMPGRAGPKATALGAGLVAAAALGYLAGRRRDRGRR